MTPWLCVLVAISALCAACDDRVLREPAVLAGHDVTATVTETQGGRLTIQIHNGRDERISKPRAALWLFILEGVPTLDVGPREFYGRQRYHGDLCTRTVEGIDPGATALIEAEIPHWQAQGVGRNNYAGRILQDRATSFDSLRLRLWIFPHRGVVDNCMSGFQKLPYLFIDPRPDEVILSMSLSNRGSFRAFMPTAERGVFHEAPPTADQSTLYFIETDLKLKRSFEVTLLTEQPPPEDW